MSRTWKRCFVSSSGATCGLGGFRWNSPRRPRLILILSDINMPGMSGLEMLPEVRAKRPDVPVIMITAYGDAETRKKAIERGAEGLLTKPIDFSVLRQEIDTRLGQAA
jgi:CheY-like chemotaxis protein